MTTASETAPATRSATAPAVLDPRRRNIVFATIVLGILLAALPARPGAHAHAGLARAARTPGAAA
ncbi:hypothetical protein, partial [Streptomyces sp. NPDC001274]